MILGSRFPTLENAETEFKEFCFSRILPNYKLEEKQIIELIKSSKWPDIFQNMSENNIIRYIKDYFPKYYSSWCNSNMTGCLYLGIDDFGEYTGIPFNGELTKQYITKIIIEQTPELLSNFENYRINVEVIKLDVIKDMLEEFNITLNKYYYNSN